MRTISNISRLCLIIAVLFVVVGCMPGSQGPVRPEQPSNGELSKPASDDNQLDPLGLPGEQDVIPRTHRADGDIVGRQDVGIVLSDSLSAGSAVVTASFDTLNSQSFRVQIYTGKVYGEARKALLIAEEIFDLPLFLDYEVPYYKLRVGSFADHGAAEDYQMKAQGAGYTSAWVVPVKVNVQEADALYEDVGELLVIPIDTTSDATENDNE